MSGSPGGRQAGAQSTTRVGELQPSPSPWPATITVVEMVTVASLPETGSASDPFLRCVACLTDVVDAYRVAENVKIARISYEQLGPLIMTYHRSWAEPYEWWGPTAMQLDHVNVKVADLEQLDPDRLKRVLQLLQHLRAQHPFSRWLELCRDRDYAFHIQGDYRATVIQTALAVEVLVFTVLACLLWEQTFPALPTVEEIGSAKTILKKDSSPLRAELGRRLGGDWSSQESPSSGWQIKGASLRNRAVHLGYRPTRHEAEQAIIAAVDLDQFIVNRLAQTVTRHHRTAAMHLGEPGLERLGAMTRRVRNLLDQSTSEPDWVQSYLEWQPASCRVTRGAGAIPICYTEAVSGVLRQAVAANEPV